MYNIESVFCVERREIGSDVLLLLWSQWLVEVLGERSEWILLIVIYNILLITAIPVGNDQKFPQFESDLTSRCDRYSKL